MSGDMEHRENRSWLDATQTGHTLDRLFGEFLAFFADHPEYDIISYGTAKVETGTTTPATWLAWANTDGSGAVPWSENSWFVVEAQKASATLNGDGTRQWQAKFQVANATGFDDCNVADTAYLHEADTGVLCVRFSPDGGWVGSGTLDFSAVVASDNYRIADVPAANCAFYLHIAGDNDTVGWVGQIDNDGQLPNYLRQRMGVIGEIVRRSSGHTKPELLIVTRMIDAIGTTAHDLGKGVGEGDRLVFDSPAGSGGVPSFSLAADGTALENHRIDGATPGAHILNAHHDGTTNDIMFATGPDPWSGDDEVMAILVRQAQSSHNSVLGQLRLFGSCDERILAGAVLGDGSYLSVGKDTNTDGGIAFVWSGEVPLF
jgi:hypothetical protein